MVNKQIQKEQACIEDLTKEIKMHVRVGRIGLAKQREQDLHNSLNQLAKLHERKRLWEIVGRLNRQGKLAKVVKRYAYQN